MIDIRKAINETSKVVIKEVLVSKPDEVFVRIESEEDTRIVIMSRIDAEELKKIMLKAQKTNEYPEQVNAIIDRGREIDLFGSVNTMGDGWGWYDSTNERKKK